MNHTITYPSDILQSVQLYFLEVQFRKYVDQARRTQKKTSLGPTGLLRQNQVCRLFARKPLVNGFLANWPQLLIKPNCVIKCVTPDWRKIA